MRKTVYNLTLLMLLATGFIACSSDSIASEDDTQTPDVPEEPSDNGSFDLNTHITAQGVHTKVFTLLDLANPKLLSVKEAVAAERFDDAAQHLLEYYRNREAFVHPDLDYAQIKVSAEDQLWADNGLKHIFQSVKGHEPICYDELNNETAELEIDWTKWPKKDKEIRYQLHRMYWWESMAKVYHTSQDESYAQEWVFQYRDWTAKNPLYSEEDLAKVSAKERENFGFAWRPLEVSERIEGQINLFQLFLNSEHFTPAFLSEFLISYANHVAYLMKNFTEEGNHRLFQAQRALFAGLCFNELKQAQKWQEAGIQILNKEIETQVYSDGGHYEMDLGYHVASINIFYKALQVAQLNGRDAAFPEFYKSQMRKMIEVTYNTNFVDNGRSPLFSDTRAGSKRVTLRNYANWLSVYPTDEVLRFFATEGKEGTQPDYLSKSFPNSGYYVFRNNWGERAMTQMVIKNGPEAGWHNQPDNGTFELKVKGRNFFPDSGAYSYGGGTAENKERAWFRQTKVHNTLTLDGKNSGFGARLIDWHENSDSDQYEYVCFENKSYPNLTHKRTIYFVEKSLFIIVDEAIGLAEGDVAIHYNFLEKSREPGSGKGATAALDELLAIYTTFGDGNDLALRTFAPEGTKLLAQEGRVSYDYNHYYERDAYAFVYPKKKEESVVRFVSVLIPTKNAENFAKKINWKNKDEKDMKEIHISRGSKNYIVPLVN